MSETSGSPPKTTRRKSLYSSVRDVPFTINESDGSSRVLSKLEASEMYNKIRGSLEKDFKQICDAFYREIRFAQDPEYPRIQLITELKKKAHGVYFCAAKSCELVTDVSPTHEIVIRAFMTGLSQLLAIAWNVLCPGRDIEIVYSVCSDFLKEPSKVLPQGLASIDPLVDEWVDRLGLHNIEPKRVPTPPRRHISPLKQPAEVLRVEEEGRALIELSKDLKKLKDANHRQEVIDHLRSLHKCMLERKTHLEAQRNRGSFTQGIE